MLANDCLECSGSGDHAWFRKRHCPPGGCDVRADAEGGRELPTDADGMSRRVADANVEAGVQTRLGSWLRPPGREHLASAKTPIPSGKQCRPRARRCEYPYHDVPVEPLQPKNTNTSSSMQAETVAHDVSPTSRHSSPPILAPYFSGWHLQFFSRTDLVGNFHTYPPLGGPFQSLQEAKDAFASHLDDLGSPIMRTDVLSQMEKAVRYCLYWADGTTKKSSKDNPKPRNISLLVQALLDKHNEDHHLSGDLAYELYGVVCFQEFYMGETGCLSMYYHLNFTTKAKGADDFHGVINNLFFAEVARIKGKNVEYVLNCFCMVKRNDNGRC